jgi:hypothetical protein
MLAERRFKASFRLRLGSKEDAMRERRLAARKQVFARQANGSVDLQEAFAQQGLIENQ